MNTGQMYVGKGNNTPSTEQTASTATQTAQNGLKIPLTADERKAAFLHAQTGLLKLVDEFMFEESASGPIELLNDLLYHWLTNPDAGNIMPDLQKEANRNQLDKAFRLVNFLAKAYQLQVDINLVNVKTQEVSRG